MWLGRWALAVLVITRALSAEAQQLPVFRAGVDLLEVDVSVVDDAGAPIADLAGSDFVVSVDGQPRKIASAQFINLRPADSPDGSPSASDIVYSSNTTSSRGRLIVMAVDRESISLGEGRRVMRAASAFLDTLGPNDKVALVTVPQGPGIAFTADHRLVQAELEEIVGTGNEVDFFTNEFGLGVIEALEIRRNPALLLQVCANALQTEVAECESNAMLQAQTIASQVGRQATATVSALMGILDWLTEIEGPKSLIWVSEGLVTETGLELGGLVTRAASARASVNVVMIDDEAFSDMSRDRAGLTRTFDRENEELGLYAIAAYTGGGVHRVVQDNARLAFERIERELSGYYLLGVEPLPEDLDGKSHRIDVSVRRGAATVRARREVQHRPVSTKIEDRLLRALRSPIAVTDLPLRVATYVYQNSTSPSARVLIVTDVERDVFDPADVMFGYQLIRPDGEVAAARTQRATLEPVDGPQGPVLEQLTAFAVEPGQYTLKLAVVEDGGRSGSVEHPVDARQMAGQRFAMGDLLLTTAPVDGTATVRPPVETRVTEDQLMVYLELYAEDPVGLGDLKVQVDVADHASGAPLVSQVGEASAADGVAARVVRAVIPVDDLPEGSYVTRAIVTRGDEELGRRSRPFEIARDPGRLSASRGASRDAEPAVETPVASLGDPAALSMLLPGPAEFRGEAVLARDAIGFFLDLVDREHPAVEATTVRMRRGEFDGAGEAAFLTGEPEAAAFLGGLEFFAKGNISRAATQFDVALRVNPDFGPALFYLGASFAATRRDEDAVEAWRKALLAGDTAPIEYLTLADALARLGHANEAVLTLLEALREWPEDDTVRRRLAIAQAVSGQPGPALDTVEPYLASHPSDNEALLVALHSLYSVNQLRDLSSTSSRDRARMAQYAEAYAAANGPHKALVEVWAASIAIPPASR